MRVVATADLHADLDSHLPAGELERLRDETAALQLEKSLKPC